ncbi:uncharacterized protein BDZ99DRAFT_513616 [Mytilinidion resinicola]|uniref:DUF7730 domain-containing protein n=1 Tax=Mytilinidion resinicola TaxID=574789 RepID=A0A6A6Z8N9_9PEZI|nr:uncharacterized protein BDZ99DRAFT_513616 [Mytilinidion resinicola]KAF2817376.1 hypothetical protein BDZ99DRAFT_513616 [Mytilinidion resinicola]
MANESKYTRQLSRLRRGPRQPSSIWPRTVHKTDGMLQRQYFPLLDLPRELRDLIYEYALVAKDGIHIRAVPPVPNGRLPICRSPTKRRSILYNGYSKYHECHFDVTYEFYAPKGPHDVCDLSIFLVNKQVYAEASKIFYSQNIFDFCPEMDEDRSFSTCHLFLMDRPTSASSKIRSLALRFGQPQFALDPLFERYTMPE